MSDTGDFRGSRGEKRQDETVMINQDQLADIVSQAKAEPAAADAPASASGGDELASSNFGKIIVIVGVVVLLVVVMAFVLTR